MQHHSLFGSPALLFFLRQNIRSEDFENRPETLKQFALLDDFDILGAIKVWQHHEDNVLSNLCSRIIDRNLFKIEVSTTPFSTEEIERVSKVVREKLSLKEDEVKYFVYSDRLSNNAYNKGRENINLLMKSGEVIDVSEASDNLNISALADPVEKYFLCYPIFKSHHPKE